MKHDRVIKRTTLTPWPPVVFMAKGIFMFVIVFQWLVGYYNQDVRVPAVKCRVFLI